MLPTDHNDYLHQISSPPEALSRRASAVFAITMHILKPTASESIRNLA